MAEALTNDIDSGSNEKTSSVVVCREQQHPLNLSGGRETLIPSRFLYGLVPQALLDSYIFWQDESISSPGLRQQKETHDIDDGKEFFEGFKRLRGYPVAEDGEHIIIVEIKNIDNSSATEDDWRGELDGDLRMDMPLAASRRDGTVRIVKRLKFIVEKEFSFKQKVASLLESRGLLVPFRVNKVVKEVVHEVVDAQKFKVGEEVECDADLSGEVKPCVINGFNVESGTYDLEYVDKFKWMSIEKDVDPDLIERRGQAERRKKGEGVWHWPGITDSEDDDWKPRHDSDDEHVSIDIDLPIEGSKSAAVSEEGAAKQRLSFSQFEDLGMLYVASRCSEDNCFKALDVIGSVPGAKPFTIVAKLAKVVSEFVEATCPRNVSDPSPEGLFDDGKSMLLLNLLYSPRTSRLHSILKVLSRIENVGHILPWTTVEHYVEVRCCSDLNA